MEVEEISVNNLTFSGTDTLVFVMLPNTAPIVLGSLTTFSYSSYRIKKPVSTIGGINTKGVAKGGRVVAGTMVFTMVNQNWINELIDSVPWLSKMSDEIIYSDELPLFDLMVVSANEYGKYVSMFVYGIDLTDEAQVISVNDLYTENTFSFIAREIRPFSNKSISAGDLTYYSNKNFSSVKFTTVTWGDSYIPSGKSKSVIQSESSTYSYPIASMQKSLIDKGYNIIPTGIMNEETSNAIYDAMEKTDLNNLSYNEFATEVLAEIEPELINNNTYKANDTINTYSSVLKDEIISFFNKDDKVTILAKTVNENGDTLYFTNKGWVDFSDLYNYKTDTLKNYIKDILVNDESVLDTIKETNKLIITTTIEKFFEGFSIKIDTTDEDIEFVSNILYFDEAENTWKNSIKKQNTFNTDTVTFKDRKYIIPKLNLNTNNSVTVVLSSDNAYVSCLIKVIFKGVSE